MKKILVAILVLALVAPAMAAVDFAVVDNEDGTATITINTNTAVVRGVALSVVCTGGAKLVDLSCIDPDVEFGFNTCVDYAFSTPVGYDIGVGHPYASAIGAGVAAVNDTTFSVSLGVLDNRTTGAAQAGFTGTTNLATINTGAGSICIDLDSLRGGVVGDGTITTNLDGTATICKAITDVPAVCNVSKPTLVKAVNPGFVNTDVTSITASATSDQSHALVYSFNWGSGYGADGVATQTNTYAFTTAGTQTITVIAKCSIDGAVSVASDPMVLTREAVKTLPAAHYNDWVTFGRPTCWGYSRNCRGDINGAGLGTGTAKKWITPTDLTAFKAAYNKANSLLPAGGICADNNHTGLPTAYSAAQKRVTPTDLTEFKKYYNQSESGPVNPVTICPATNYNFWTN